MHSTPRGLRTPYYEREAEGLAPPLLLLHPLGGNLRFWDACRAIWAGRRALVAYDRAGAGCTPAPEHPIRRADSLAEIDTLCDALGLDRVIPVGVAVGAMIAAAYAATRPERVPAVVLSNPATALSEAGRALTLTRLATVRRGGVEALLPAIIDRAFNGLPHGPAYAEYTAVFRENTAEGYAATALAAMELTIADDLPRIACPALVTVGAHDVLFPPAEAQAVAALLPQAQYQEVPDAAHFPPIQTPQRFVDTADAFISSVCPA